MRGIRMKVLGVDPGLGTTGYGLIEESKGTLRVLEAGFVRTSGSAKVSERLKKIHDALDGLMREYTPDVVALEGLYSHYKHPTSVIMMAHARGVICLLSGIHKIKLVNYPATKIKKSITGNGMASKFQVQSMVRDLLNLDRLCEPPDVADALAVALSHFYIAGKARP